jgi:thiol:disulfide interchange protein DsbC
VARAGQFDRIRRPLRQLAKDAALKNNAILPVLVAAISLVGAQHASALTKEELAATLKGVDPSDITASPIPGIFEVAVGSSVAYVTEDGHYLMQGELYDLESNANLTEEKRASTRVEVLAGVAAKDMIVFSPENGEVAHTITIFTDIDCGYCRQFHREIADVNALGIEVHYLFYPRTGPDTDSWAKAEKVWCASDRHEALTRAKLGGTVPDLVCSDTPVSAHYDLGQSVGVRGTPAVFTASGENIGGYLPPATLLQRLEELGQPAQ